jgi:aminoglycoside phosphotransferase (APT) family kinase protein
MEGERLVGFFDWDIARPSPRESDLAFSAIVWVPLSAPDAGERSGSHDVADRSRRLHLLLDGVAEAGDRAAIALLPIASRLEQAASYVEALPDDFWKP